VIYTVGHSSRSLQALVSLLRDNDVERIVDVRRFPSSRRFPWFNRDLLAESLGDIRYVWLAALGGRRGRQESPVDNRGWENESFRNYADYMQSAAFREALAEVQPGDAVMCAEAMLWQCHRGLIADALTVAGHEVTDILDAAHVRLHRLPPFAHVEGGRLWYPPPQTTLPF
jgi:uncharacterized protein (DUF488 family)